MIYYNSVLAIAVLMTHGTVYGFNQKQIRPALLSQHYPSTSQHRYLQLNQCFIEPIKCRQYYNHQYHKSTIIMYGLLDEINSGAYDLLSSSSNDNSGNSDNLSEAYEVFLAELVFSTNDPRIDIANKIDLATDPDFLHWLEFIKIDKSTDPDERLALRDLLEMIVDVTTKIEVNKIATERAEQERLAAEQALLENSATVVDTESTTPMTAADILRKATQIQTQTSDADMKKVKKTFYEQELTPEIRKSYEKLLKKVLPPYKPGDNPTSIVLKFYDQFDAQFVKVLNERSSTGDAASAAVLEALAEEQRKRIALATENLRLVLSAGEPMKMEGVIVKMAREGKVDESFLLLLEANRDQARNAGAHGPADLMDRLRKRAIDEKDKQMQSKEIRLLRKLLRTDDSKERELILEDAFTPREALIVAGTTENARKAIDGERPDNGQPMPDVPPPDFINACKAVMLNFGNLGSDDDNQGDLASRIRRLAAEAEVVATRIYGKGMTLREQQDRAWAEQTTSIWDLERLEIEAERSGEVAPWSNPNDDDMFLPGFDKDGRMQVGGS